MLSNLFSNQLRFEILFFFPYIHNEATDTYRKINRFNENKPKRKFYFKFIREDISI